MNGVKPSGKFDFLTQKKSKNINLKTKNQAKVACVVVFKFSVHFVANDQTISIPLLETALI